MSDQHEKRDERHHPLVKVVVNLLPSDWHDYGLETLWADPIGTDRYRLKNVPFYAYGLSYEDIVRAKPLGGQLIVQEVCERSGNSTYRLFLADGARTDQKFLTFWQPLELIGATYEQANDRLLAVDLPTDTDIYKAYELLKSGEEAGAWDFEEAHCGHSLLD